jgi:hypothetical protein
MEKFHIIVLSIATVALILILIFVGILLSKGNTNEAYPPSYGTCPDYWEVDTDEKTNTSKCIIPNIQTTKLNIGNMYDESTMTLKDAITYTPGYSYDISNNVVTQYIDFSDSKWTGVCDKRKWANENGIVWDGISNYNSC